MKSTTVSNQQVALSILIAVSMGHFFNDLIQMILPASYDFFKGKYRLTYAQIGLITFAFQMTSSLLQPFVGRYTDKHPQPYSFLAGMLFAFSGLLLLSVAWNFTSILIAASLIGMGSSVFHPEASRVAYYASGGKRSFAQAIFQLGGNGGTAVGPLMIALFVLPFGQYTIAFFTFFAVIGGAILYRVSKWYKNYLESSSFKKNAYNEAPINVSPLRIKITIGILLLLLFSKYFFTASISSYYVFYLQEKFHITKSAAQVQLFLYLFAFALGTLIGGPMGDKFGRKRIIWFSILGAAPFTLALPYVNLFWTSVFIIVSALILASAFPSILVYAQELLPGKIGMISGLFYGFAFGMGGISSALLGELIDHTNVMYVYQLCSFAPLIGLVAAFLPNIKKRREQSV
jgi:FSR family fosmidomycin resistance protein-like MFS transporter